MGFISFKQNEVGGALYGNDEAFLNGASLLDKQPTFIMKNILITLLLLFSVSANAQTNVRAWYADGQVWVVWETEFPYPDWYGVYAKPNAFGSTNDAVFVGRLHKFEYGNAALKEQLDSSATPRIPSPTGIGKYQLAENEGLFVFTPPSVGHLVFCRCGGQ